MSERQAQTSLKHAVSRKGMPFICPICHGGLVLQGHSLICGQKHCYDMARQGYVNLLPKKPVNAPYEEKTLFSARRAVYEAGFFAPLIAEMKKWLSQGLVLDAGCGEGSLLDALVRDTNCAAVGVDIAKPAIIMAASRYKEASWCVGDLCNIPLPNASVDCIVNVLTPANYREFERVLKKGARLLKVTPNAGHLKEIRAMAGKSPYDREASAPAEVFQTYFALRDTFHIKYRFPCDIRLAEQVYTMTPLTAHTEYTPEGKPIECTVDVTLLVGEK